MNALWLRPARVLATEHAAVDTVAEAVFGARTGWQIRELSTIHNGVPGVYSIKCIVIK